MFKSYVSLLAPQAPLKLAGREGGLLTLPEIILSSVPELNEGASFWTNPLLPSGHLQTAYTALNKFENVDKVHYKRHVLQMKNLRYQVGEDFLNYDQWSGKSTFCIDYAVPESMSDPDHEKYRPESQTKELPPRTEYLNPETEFDLLSDDSKPPIICLHGLSGGSYELYIRAFVSRVTEYNFDALVLNARGCANHTITTPQLFNGLWTNDLRYLINEHISKKWPNKRIYLIGFSLGGAITANYLGQEFDQVYHNIKGAATVGTPWDFPDSLILLRESLLGHHIYSPAMCQNLLKLLNEHYEGHLKSDPAVEEFKKNPAAYSVNRLRDFDDAFTSRLFGFNGANDYYRLASPVQRLHKVRVPLIILSSKDDPITGYRTLPHDEVKQNPYTLLITTTVGGHLGWFTLTGKRWYADPMAKLMKQLDEHTWSKESVPQTDLPRDLSKVFKHDRLVQEVSTL